MSKVREKFKKNGKCFINGNTIHSVTIVLMLVIYGNSNINYYMRHIIYNTLYFIISKQFLNMFVYFTHRNIKIYSLFYTKIFVKKQYEIIFKVKKLYDQWYKNFEINFP